MKQREQENSSEANQNMTQEEKQKQIADLKRQMEKSNIGVISDDANNMMLHIKNDMESKLKEAE